MLTRIYSPYGAIPQKSQSPVQPDPDEQRDASEQNPSNSGQSSKKQLPTTFSSPPLGMSSPFAHQLTGSVSASSQRAASSHPTVAPPMQLEPRDVPSLVDENGVTRPLASVHEQVKFQKITLNSVIRDFNSTVSALGVEGPVKAEVENYLSIIQNEGTKPAPSAPLIRQLLKTSANTLDQYITDALGQSSKVVQEWVDALLMQKIDYTYRSDAQSPSDLPKASTASSAPASRSETETIDPSESPENAILPEPASSPLHRKAASTSKVPQTVASPQSPMPRRTERTRSITPKSKPLASASHVTPAMQPSPAVSNPVQALSSSASGLTAHDAMSAVPDGVKKQLFALLEEGKARAWAGQYPQATDRLEKALSLAQSHNAPALVGKIHHRLGRLQAEQKQGTLAQQQFELAADAFQQAGLMEKSLKAAKQSAHWAMKTGRADQAKSLYQRLVQSGEAIPATDEVEALNQLGTLTLSEGNPQEALDYYLQAYGKAVSAKNTTPQVLSDLYSNMGAAFKASNQYQRASQAYQRSLHYAKAGKSRSGFLQSLHNLKSLYETSGQNTQALKIHQQYQKLIEQWGIQAV